MYHIKFIRHLCNLHGMSLRQGPGRQPKKAGSHIAGESAEIHGQKGGRGGAARTAVGGERGDELEVGMVQHVSHSCEL